jgi:intein-encoded DNA endonuclease-like protein
METVYPFPPKKYESLPGVFKLGYHNVELGSFFRSKARGLLKDIQRMEKERQRIFLRAFFDDEGSVYFIGKRRAIRGYQHNSKILNLIHHLLKNFNIESKVDKKYNEITVTRKENIECFAREINFAVGVYINGDRTNSVWKQSLEKRELLKRALDSYQ